MLDRRAARLGDGEAHHDLVVAGDLADRAALPGDVGEERVNVVVAGCLDLDAVLPRAGHVDSGIRASAAASSPAMTLRMAAVPRGGGDRMRKDLGIDGLGSELQADAKPPLPASDP